jgi:hypothetical protein
MKKTVRATDFLQNMAQAEQVAAPIAAANGKTAQAEGVRPAKTRAGLKHIGGYLSADAVEKVAILRARLRLDNSELITLAINELHARQNAKRAFGDN